MGNRRQGGHNFDSIDWQPQRCHGTVGSVGHRSRPDGDVAKWFKAEVCKTSIRRFESGRRLFILPQGMPVEAARVLTERHPRHLDRSWIQSGSIDDGDRTRVIELTYRSCRSRDRAAEVFVAVPAFRVRQLPLRTPPS